MIMPFMFVNAWIVLPVWLFPTPLLLAYFIANEVHWSTGRWVPNFSGGFAFRATIGLYSDIYFKRWIMDCRLDRLDNPPVIFA